MYWNYLIVIENSTAQGNKNVIYEISLISVKRISSGSSTVV